MLDPHEALHKELSDRYELEDVLGKGGMGTVYLARDRKHDRLVAIKTVDPDVTTAELRARFEREIGIIAHLQHPHILPLLDSGVAGDTLYYIMPYVEGESLRSRLERDGRLPVKEIVRIAGDVAEALQYAHRQGVIHRDIKPENILLTADYAVVADFGIAKAFADTGAETLTGTGLVVGSPAYMAPEQATGEATPRSDIYALGAVLYEAATGQRWRGGTEAEVNWWGVPSAFRAVIQRALSSSPEDRWPDAAAFRRTLKASIRAPRQLWRTVVVGAVSAVLLAAVIWWAATNLGSGRTEVAERGGIQKLAVLPLENLSGDPEEEYFADGMTDELIGHLAQIRALRVTSRTSVMQYKGVRKPLPEIARELNVDVVVAGTVRRAEGRVRMTMHLIDAASDQHLWAKSFDRELRDVLALQSEAALAIAREIHVELTPQEGALLATVHEVDEETYEAYLRGRFFRAQLTERGFYRGIDHFERAIELNPRFAQAYAGLAGCFCLLAGHGLEVMPVPAAMTRVRDAASKALELDPDLAEAHAAMGMVKLKYEWDGAEAERHFLRAIEINPSYSLAQLWYSIYLTAVERHGDAVMVAQRALELDPLSLPANINLAQQLYEARRYDETVTHLNSVLELAPDFWGIHWSLGEVYRELGRIDEAIESLERGLGLTGGDNALAIASLGYTYGVAGMEDRAREELERLTNLASEKYVSPAHVAMIYAGLGETEEVFGWLERAYEIHSRSLIWLRVAHEYETFRSDPRFQDLVERVGL